MPPVGTPAVGLTATVAEQHTMGALRDEQERELRTARRHTGRAPGGNDLHSGLILYHTYIASSHSSRDAYGLSCT